MLIGSHASTDQLQMHQDEGAQHGVMTGSGAYHEYPQGMVSTSSSYWRSYDYYVGSNKWPVIRSTKETTSQFRWCFGNL